MEKEKICREAAEEEVKGWESNFDVILSPEISSRLTRAVMTGRLTFDEVKVSFTLKLRRPLEMESGGTVDSLTIREPRTAERQKVGKKGGGVEMMSGLLSAVTGHPASVLRRLPLKDFMILGELFSFFT